MSIPALATDPEQVAHVPPRGALERCLEEAGHTPPVRALPGLIAALVESADDRVKTLERAIARAGTAALQSALGAMPQLASGDRPRVYALLLRLAGDRPAEDDVACELYQALVTALGEPLAQSRKLAVRALAKLADAGAEGPLLEALGRAPTVEQKGIVDALGALGGSESRQVLGLLEVASDADLARRRDRACLLIERRLAREEPAALAFDERLARPCQVALTCRSGLAEVLAAELEPLGAARVRGPDRVELQFGGSLRDLLVARTALELGLSFPISVDASLPPAERIAAAVTGGEVLAALEGWTVGVPRFRVAWADGAHHRAQTWALARAVGARTSALLNDSRQAPWTLRAPADGLGEICLVPRLSPDPRFAYRSAAVPASSHPTIAAALARIAGVRSDDVVWDPFVGSGLELVERARLGPARELWGSDIDARALDAARINLTAAGLGHARLIEASALSFAPPDVSLIITNPPMGRRVARDGSLEALLEGVVRHAAAVLRPSGRLVWLSPLERKTERVARALGLGVTVGPDVDVGGFFARVQVFTRAS